MDESAVLTTTITEEIVERLAFFGITAIDREQLRAISRRQLDASGLIDSLYRHLLAFPHTRDKLDGGELVDRLKKAQQQYFVELLSGNYDSDYFERRSQVGWVHTAIGLDAKWYLGGYCHYLICLIRQMGQPSTPVDIEELIALLKGVFLDISIAFDSYMAAEYHAIRLLKNYAETVFTQLEHGILLLDTDLQIRKINSFFNRYGIVAKDYTGRSVTHLFSDEDFINRLRAHLQSENSIAHWPFRWQVRQKWYDLRVMLKTVALPDMHVHVRTHMALLVQVEDCTEREHALEQVRMLAGVVSQTNDSVMITDTDATIHYVNPAFEMMTGYSRDEAIGAKPSLIRSGLQSNEFYQNLWRNIKNGKAYSNVFINRRKNGELFYEEKTIMPLLDTQGKVTHYCATGKDITEQIHSENRLQKLTLEHPVTGLANRTSLMNYLQREISASEHLAVLHLNLDRFRHMNSLLGYAGADAVLRKMGERLRGYSDTIFVAHLSADDFVVVIPECASLESVRATAERMLNIVSMPFVEQGQEMVLTATTGIAVYPYDGDDAQTLLQHAFLALQKPKKSGGDKLHFFDYLSKQHSPPRMEMETHLRRAVRNLQFNLLYQPQVRLSDGRVAGVEALLRWNHPQWGVLSPTEFIPVLEETGLIVDVGQWVLREACSQMQCCPYRNADMHVSVNLSAVQLRQNNIVAAVADALAKSGLPPNQLILEITESSLMHDTRRVYKILNTLSLMDVRLAIDDFGTGFSSLNYLREFPFDFLKLDKSFIQELEYQKNNATIAEAIVHMAKGLKMQVIAEGVENENQLAFLNDLGCELIQGFIFSRPLPASELQLIFQTGKRL